MLGVERVAGARVVHVVARVVGHEPVVGLVVDALEGQHRAEVVALGGVVVDDVEDHLDARAVQRLDHALELAHLLAVLAGGGVAGVRGEEADRRVAPVVGEPALEQERLVDDVVDGQQLDRGDAEVAQVGERRLGGEAGVGAAQLLAHLGVQAREAAHVRLVDHRLVQRRVRAAVALPVEARVDDHRLRDGVDVVLVVALEVGVLLVGGDVGEHVGRVPAHRAVDRLRVRVEQQLGGVEAVAGLGLVGPVDAEAVALARPDARAGSSARCARCARSGRPAARRRRRRTGTARRARRARRRARSSCRCRPRSRRAGTALPGQTSAHRTSAPASGGSTT